MSWLDLIDRVIRRVREAHETSAVASWLRRHGESKAAMFMRQPRDEELEEASHNLENLFDALDKRTNGKFYENYD